MNLRERAKDLIAALWHKAQPEEMYDIAEKHLTDSLWAFCMEGEGAEELVQRDIKHSEAVGQADGSGE